VVEEILRIRGNAVIDRAFVNRINEENIPLSGSLELTHRCNLSCRHCYQYAPSGEEMSLERWKKLMDELAAAGCLFLAFTGGEPMLREDVFHILESAAEKSFAITLQTNATLLDRDKVRLLGQMPTLRVDVSLYGIQPSTHDQLTGVEGSYTAARRALDLLREEGIPTMIKVVVGSFNLDEVEGIAELADQLDAPAMFTSLIFPRNDRDPAPTSLRLDDEGLERFMRFELDYLPRYLSEVMDEKIDDLADYVQRCAIGPADPGSEEKRYCGGGRTIFAINPYGDVYPCVAFPLVVGNIVENGFVEIWRNSPQLLELRMKEMEIPDRCGECSYLDRCGICRALSYQEQGEVIALSEEKCRLTRTLMKVLENA
jgi:radical SAM protein with 4Fe4S-binding SPASM domain